MTGKSLTKKFFDRPTLKVAHDLLGKFLVCKFGKKKITLLITEVEAYDGLKDKASHAHRGLTERNKIMFGHAGIFYVYLTYGMHWMLNIVTGHPGYPAAILIRGGYDLTNKRHVSGPGRLTKYLKINKGLNGRPASTKSGLWFEDRGYKISSRNIKRTPRIGVDYAGLWAKKPYRFVITPKKLHQGENWY
jgi:DNA-3-methyladenine glycosylase